MESECDGKPNFEWTTELGSKTVQGRVIIEDWGLSFRVDDDYYDGDMTVVSARELAKAILAKYGDGT